MFGGKKQVLIVGNEGVQLFVVANKKVSLYGDYATNSETLSHDLREAFGIVKAPLLILFDVVEQQYRKENIPPVSSFDKAKVIQRKLLMAFPQQQMRAFVPLKQKPGDGDGLVLLFAALGFGPVVEKIMDAILGSEIFVSGTGLLPLESTSLVNKLVQKTHERAKTGNDTRWSILMTYHKTGGLRQIVIKDGELALTRLTPLSADMHNVVQFTDEMAREFNSTLIYLSRFGYSPADGLDLIVVSSPDVCQQLRQLPLSVTHLYPLTTEEAGQLLGVSVESQQGSVFGEIVHAAWGGIQKIAVPLTAPVINKIKNVRQASRAAIILLFLTSCFLLYQSTMMQIGSMTLQSEIIEQNSRKQVLQHQVDELTRSLNILKFDPEKIRGMITLHEEYSKRDLDLEPLLQKIVRLIDRNAMRLRDIAITQADEATEKTYREEMAAAGQASSQASPPGGGGMPGGMVGGAPGSMPGGMPNGIPGGMPMGGPAPGGAADGQGAEKPVVIVKMTIRFPEEMAIEQAAQVTNDFVARTKQQLPAFKVTVDKMVGNLAVDKTIQGASEQVAQGKIEGVMVKEEESSFTMIGVLP